MIGVQSEARQLALQADRMDSGSESSMGGLSIWVGLAALLSNSSERGKVHDALKEAKEMRKAEKESTPLDDKAPHRDGTGARMAKRMSKVFGLGKKDETSD